MQFKHPEILYVLFALLIPVFIHLFQLQRYTKTPFTNVKFLKKVVLQTRKSSRLKKWLVLLSRILAFATIIIAFAQPYFSKNDTSKSWNTIIYLDNSLSMSTKGERGELLKRAIQDLTENLPEKGQYILITNDVTSTKLSKELVIKQLKNTDYSNSKIAFNTLLLKVQQLYKNTKNQHNKLLFISDFQKSTNENIKIPDNLNFDYVALKATNNFNIAIDSVYINQNGLEVLIRNQGETAENISISAFQNQIVLSKSTFNISTQTTQRVSLQIPENSNNLSLKLDVEDRFSFDNTYYISLKKQDKINVLLINEQKSFLERIFTSDEFNLVKNLSNKVQYELIDKQQLIVLNGIKKPSAALQTKLKEFVEKGGDLVIIPHKSSHVEDINPIFKVLNMGSLESKHSDSLLITKIHFSHPLLHNVFDKKIHNFQYPSVTTYFESTLFSANPVLSFENQKAFISQMKKKKGNIYWVAAPLDKKSSNFTNAPLIVPIFYNIGKLSGKHTELSYRIGSENEIHVNEKLEKDEVLQIENADYSFIPRQEIQSEKVVLYTKEQPQKAGFYNVKNKKTLVQNLAFNNDKTESSLSFIKLEENVGNRKNIKSFSTIKEALTALSSDQNIQSYFKYFILLALLFLLIEILLLKYL